MQRRERTSHSGLRFFEKASQKLIKTSRREAPDCGAKRRIRAPRARSARGASQLCVSKKSFCFFWMRACTTKRECSPRGRCGFGGVCFSTYPDFHVALFIIVTSKEPKINANTNTHTHDTRIAIAITLVNEEAFCSSCISVVLIIISPF